MTSIKDHPVVAWIGFVLGLVSAVLMVAGAYVYGESLQREQRGLNANVVERTDRIYRLIESRNEEKRALDTSWLLSDQKQAQAIQTDIRILRELLNVDASLPYQIGLRDGKRLCVE